MTQSKRSSSIVEVDSLDTLKDAYKSGLIKGDSTSSYTADAALLDKVAIWQGDITHLKIDAIVNAANKSLLGGGGVDGAIHRAAGPELLEECKTLNGADTGEAKMTDGYNLPASKVVHTVGPVHSASKKSKCEEQLASCYRNSLELVVKHKLKTIAFPGISTGVYGYPVGDATAVALRTARDFLDSSAGSKLSKVVFVCFSEKNVDEFYRLVPEYFQDAS